MPTLMELFATGVATVIVSAAGSLVLVSMAVSVAVWSGLYEPPEKPIMKDLHLYGATAWVLMAIIGGCTAVGHVMYPFVG